MCTFGLILTYLPWHDLLMNFTKFYILHILLTFNILLPRNVYWSIYIQLVLFKKEKCYLKKTLNKSWSQLKVLSFSKYLITFLENKICNSIQHSMTIVNIPPLFADLSFPFILLMSDTIQDIASFSHWVRRSRCKGCVVLYYSKIIISFMCFINCLSLLVW